MEKENGQVGLRQRLAREEAPRQLPENLQKSFPVVSVSRHLQGCHKTYKSRLLYVVSYVIRRNTFDKRII